jgi:hypothetical protein
MHEVFRALNALVEQGVIQTYGIGGAVAASFYTEALQTEDIDAFVYLPETQSGLLDLSGIYTALMALGGKLQREYIQFGPWPLQILPDATPLVSEAIRDAEALDYDGIAVRVFRPEHLCSIALQTGRAKDLLRVRMFLDAEKVDLMALQQMVARFGLGDRLRKVEGLIDGAS